MSACAGAVGKTDAGFDVPEGWVEEVRIARDRGGRRDSPQVRGLAAKLGGNARRLIPDARDDDQVLAQLPVVFDVGAEDVLPQIARTARRQLNLNRGRRAVLEEGAERAVLEDTVGRGLLGRVDKNALERESEPQRVVAVGVESVVVELRRGEAVGRQTAGVQTAAEGSQRRYLKPRGVETRCGTQAKIGPQWICSRSVIRVPALSRSSPTRSAL